ncbi:MAG: hypothetical protein LBF91_01445 [Azoarcus sp.]|jgi:hypothetical protein|nr:hypothetical protein [Azoarcus sp.]
MSETLFFDKTRAPSIRIDFRHVGPPGRPGADGSGAWGGIGGDITAQADLTERINELADSQAKEELSDFDTDLAAIYQVSKL